MEVNGMGMFDLASSKTGVSSVSSPYLFIER